MIDIEELKHTASELVINSNNDFEMMQNVDKLRMAMVSGCETYKEFGHIGMRLKSNLGNQSKGRVRRE